MKTAKRLLKNQLSADILVEKLLVLSKSNSISLLDSGNVSHLKSHLLICGINPAETFEIVDGNHEQTLGFLDAELENPDKFAIFTISYDFGLKLENINPAIKPFQHSEPDVFLALFDFLILHDYDTGETFLLGDENRFSQAEALLDSVEPDQSFENFVHRSIAKVSSNFTKTEYLAKIEEIKEFIRRGDTYQTNLTQQMTAVLPEELTAQQIFYNLRKDHPAPFASFIQRNDSTVISASPERFFSVRARTISTSPIKGTRPRGKNPAADEKLKNELLASEKDRAENVMIVDLLRNDLGRVCEFGSVFVEKLCDLEEHPTLFHLVSTVTGKIRPDTQFSDLIRAVFPCGSITGAPKISTMQIIDRLETANRGLSMGAIGYSIPSFEIAGENSINLTETGFRIIDLSVAIRTMRIKDGRAIFNVGGGIVIDSRAEDEYEETLVKAKALLKSLNGALNVS